MMTIRDVMTSRVMTVEIATPLRDVAGLLNDRRISGLPVVDAAGAVVGVVSETDFLVKAQGPDVVQHRPLSRLLGDSIATRQQMAKINATTAGEAMTSPAITIAPNRRINEAAQLMTSHRVNRLPVVEDGRLVGIVTRSDIVRAYVRTDAELAGAIRQDVLLRSLWVDPSTFSVEVLNGAVTITGHADRRSTAEIIERAVALVPGVVAVAASITWSLDDSRPEGIAVDPYLPVGPH
jgi:CBS-domain-containing membrane protein